MIHQTPFDLIDSPIKPVPRFKIEPPDGARNFPEDQRQNAFFKIMRDLAPAVSIYPNANAGKRNPAKARLEHIRAGVFDITATWAPKRSAWIELKGYSKAGQAGKLSDTQIEFGNLLMDQGHDVACFFDPWSAVDWLRELGAPVRAVR